MTMIYHYCDANAFLSIMESGKLRLTNTRRMNDHSEGLIIERAVLGVLRDRNDMADVIPYVEEHLSVRRQDLYACCFSEAEDSVTQWMTYGDDGRGFAIGFDSDLLWQNRVHPLQLYDERYYCPIPSLDVKQTIALTKVLYCNRSRLESIAREILSKTIPTPQRRSHPSSGTDWLVTQVFWVAAVGKDQAFECEKEWRLIHSPSFRYSSPEAGMMVGELSWRMGRYGITP